MPKRVRLRVNCQCVNKSEAILRVREITFPSQYFSARGKQKNWQHTGVYTHNDSVIFIAGGGSNYYNSNSLGVDHVLCFAYPGAPIKIPPAAWTAIKEAVKAYNEWVEEENLKFGNTEN